MDTLDTLQNLAEVGVAITGFAGIVAAVAHSATGSWSADDRGNFAALVRWSLGATFLAYVPIIFASLGSLVPAPWRISNAIFAVFHGWVFFVTFKAIRERQIPVPRSGVFFLTVGSIVMVAEMAAAAGPLSSVASSVYLTATIWFLLLAANRFLALVNQHFGSPPA